MMEGLESNFENPTPIRTEVDSSTRNTYETPASSVNVGVAPIELLKSSSPKRKNQSVVWEHFTVLKNPDGMKMVKPKAKCKHYLQTYFFHTKGNDTSSMKHRLLYYCGEVLMAEIATTMKLKFDKYWEKLEEMNKVLLVAILLDPRYKLLYMEYFYPKIQQEKSKVKIMVNELKNIFLNLYMEYMENDFEAAQANLSATQPRFDGANTTMIEDDSHAASMQEFMRLRKEKDVVEIKNEVNKYLLEVSKDPSNLNFSLLGW